MTGFEREDWKPTLGKCCFVVLQIGMMRRVCYTNKSLHGTPVALSDVCICRRTHRCREFGNKSEGRRISICCHIRRS